MLFQAKLRVRRKRGWAPEANGVAHLARSARQLARASASRIALPAVSACLEKYRRVTDAERACKLIRGDLLVVLIDGHGLRAIDIARETGERPGDISQMYAVAKAFPRAFRPGDSPYNHLLLATRMVRKFPRLAMTHAKALAIIRHAGLTQHRDVTRHFSVLERGLVGANRLLPELRLAENWLDRAHNCRFQDLLGVIPDGSIQILAIDPPYVYGDSTYRSQSARSLACDNDDPAAATTLVTYLLRNWQPKLATGGVALLWQPWQNLMPEIVQAAEACRWSLIGPVIWDKGRTQPGSFVSPYSVQGEMLWLLHRPGDTLLNHDGSSREMILRFAPVSFPSTAAAQLHAFEKPEALCELLIRKHSRPGDLVFDACGCTGGMSVAAINSGRRWVYAESNLENFGLGEKRIVRRLAENAAAAS